MNLSIKNSLLAASTLACVKQANAYVDFKNQDESVLGRIQSGWFTSYSGYLDTIQPCGPFYQLMGGWNWKPETIGKMALVPGISPQIGITGASESTIQCIQQVVNASDAHSSKVFWGVVLGLAGAAGVAALSVAVVRSGVLARTHDAVNHAASEAAGAVHRTTQRVLGRRPEVTAEEFELTDADTVFEADLEAGSPDAHLSGSRAA